MYVANFEMYIPNFGTYIPKFGTENSSMEKIFFLTASHKVYLTSADVYHELLTEKKLHFINHIINMRLPIPLNQNI